MRMTRWNDTKLCREARPCSRIGFRSGLALMQAFDISHCFSADFLHCAHTQRAVQKQNACISKLTQAFR
jgi:hypothetical protein